MKRSTVVLILLAFLAMPQWVRAQANWTDLKFPGGSALETVVVNGTGATHPKGMWICEKQRGMFWVDWNASNHAFTPATDQSHEFDAYYLWFMGCDTCTFGNDLSDYHVLTATYEGIHQYECSGYSNPAWTWTYSNTGNTLVENNNWRWHDAVYYFDPVNSSFYEGSYIVSAVQPDWDGTATNNYKTGLFLITNNSVPPASAAPIVGANSPNFDTFNHNYSYLHRDMSSGDTIYVYYHDENWSALTETAGFQKLWLSNNSGQIQISISADQAGLTSNYNVVNFYQFKEGTTSYQFIIVDQETSIDPNQSNFDPHLYFRSRIAGQSWGNWTHLRDLAGDEQGMGMVVRKDAANFYVYLNVGGYGLRCLKCLNSSPYTFDNTNRPLLNSDGTDYIRKFTGRSLNIVPNAWLEDEDYDMLIVGSADGDVFTVKVDNTMETPQVVSIDKLH